MKNHLRKIDVPWLFPLLVCFMLASFSPLYAYETVGDGTGSGNCYACHADRYEEDAEWHILHQANAVDDCTTCHETPEGGGIVSMTVCSGCHEHEDALNTWVEEHEVVAPGTCTACHVIDDTDDQDPDEGCPAVFLLGEDNPQLDTLRQFRDEVLAKNPAGQKIIDLYYKSGNTVTTILETNPALKKYAKKLLQTLMSAM